MKKIILGKQLFHSAPALCLLLAMIVTHHIHAESYTLSVGESVTISQTAYYGFIDNVGLADYLDPHLEFTKDYDGSATITVNSYFDYTATVSLVFVERYTYLGHTRAETYYRDVKITCKYTAPDPSKKPTKVTVPKRVRVELGKQAYVTPSIEPYGASVTSIRWYKSSGNAYYNLQGSGSLKDTRGIVTGKSLGIGKAYVEVNDDENLRSYFEIEVVDPDNLPPTGVVLPSSYEISVGGHTTINPILSPSNSSTSYTWSSDNTSIVVVTGGKVTGIGVGTATIKVKTANNLTASCVVKVVSTNGKDDKDDEASATMGIIEGREYVDLGLSVKWATYDVGASKQGEKGQKFAWGETETKTEFSWSNYKYGNDYKTVKNIGSNIKGTQYDAAYVNWDSNWCMPSETEAREMISKCTFSTDNVNGIDGYRATGPNGNSIFFPVIGDHWTSSLDSRSNFPDYATCIRIYYNSQSYSWVTSYASESRAKGLYVRAVSSADATTSHVQPTSISIDTPSMNVQKGKKVPFTVTVTPTNATTTLRWESSNPSVAMVSGSGLLTAIKDGTTTISVTTGNGLTAKCHLLVGEGNAEQLLLSASPSGGEVPADTKVYLNTTNATGADIYYTLNGTTPTKSSTKYTSSGITINESCTLKAIAYKEGYEASDVLIENYIIKSSTEDSTIENGVVAAEAGNQFSLIVMSDYSLWGCGLNYSGQLGCTPSTNNSNSYPSPIKIMDGVKTISAGYSHSLILKKDGTVWACGGNEYGQLGDGSFVDRYTPVKVMEDVAEISAGGFFSLFLKKDNSLWSCGWNVAGQLGNGTTNNSSIPVKIAEDVIAVAAGAQHTLMLKRDATVWGCGDNSSGQLGDKSFTNRLFPIKIMDDVSSIVAEGVSRMLKLDGTLWACGSNYNGGIGDGTFIDRNAPVLVDNNVESLAKGGGGYIKNDGELWVCGSNAYGNLGDGTTINRSTPVKVLDNVAYATIGKSSTSFAIKRDGSLWAWGFNGGGQFGNGTREGSYVPIMVLDGHKSTSNVQVEVSYTGYATFHSSESAYTLPSGLSAQVVIGMQSGKLKYKTIADGSVSGVIPKDVAVMLVSDAKQAGTCTLTPSESTATYSGTNLLHGSDEATTTKGDGLHYKLSYGPSGTQWNDVFGWYWGAQNGAPFQIEGHKAWLVVPRGNGTRAAGFTIEGEVLGVDSLEEDIPSDIYFDLQGRRISEPAKKGFYIKNGKKIVLK